MGGLQRTAPLEVRLAGLGVGLQRIEGNREPATPQGDRVNRPHGTRCCAAGAVAMRQAADELPRGRLAAGGTVPRRSPDHRQLAGGGAGDVITVLDPCPDVAATYASD